MKTCHGGGECECQLLRTINHTSVLHSAQTLHWRNLCTVLCDVVVVKVIPALAQDTG